MMLENDADDTQENHALFFSRQHLVTPSTTADLPALQARFGARYRWLLLASVMLGTMASVMSSTIVNVAIPDISRHFGLGQERAQWVGSGFMLAMTVSMLTTPWLLGRFGERRSYSVTLWLLLLGGLIGGLADNFYLMLAGRMAQGLAAGVMQPMPAIVILRIFGAKETGRATGIFGMGVVLATALGPTVGGLLVHALGWRSIFFMVIPFCLASLWMAQRYVPMRLAGLRGGRLDWLGLLFGALATVGLLNGLVQCRVGSALTASLLLGMAGLGLLAFLAWQRHLGRSTAHAHVEPLMRLALFHHPRFAVGCVVAFLYGVALFGSTYLLPVYLQLALGLSPAQTGWILLPAGVALALTIGGVGRLLDRRPHYPLASLGFALLAASLALMLVLGLDSAWGWLVAWVLLGRIGLGLILPSMHLGTLRGLQAELFIQGASVSNFMRVFGGAVGVSLCGIVLEWRVAAHGDSLKLAPGSTQRLAAFNEVFVLLAVLCLLAMLAAWKLRATRASAGVGP
jgi:EmrB/QacA subfamily drug resistance transporter